MNAVVVGQQAVVLAVHIAASGMHKPYQAGPVQA